MNEEMEVSGQSSRENKRQSVQQITELEAIGTSGHVGHPALYTEHCENSKLSETGPRGRRDQSGVLDRGPESEVMCSSIRPFL